MFVGTLHGIPSQPDARLLLIEGKRLKVKTDILSMLIHTGILVRRAQMLACGGPYAGHRPPQALQGHLAGGAPRLRFVVWLEVRGAHHAPFSVLHKVAHHGPAAEV